MERLPLGVIVRLTENPLEDLSKVRELGFPTCQIYCPSEDYLSGIKTKQLKEAIKETAVRITTVFLRFDGQIWDFEKGPETIGFVPLKTRAERIKIAKRVSDFARSVEVESVSGHVGFIPENLNDPLYKGLIPDLRNYTKYCRNNGQFYCFETGQETPITLLRAIEDIGTKNLGINFDCANLIMYGKANPLDALDIIGHLVLGTHCKDGKYPTNPRQLGKEYPLGEGDVNFLRLIPKLKSKGYRGPLTIEREIHGEKQIRDILRAKKVLEKLLRKIC